MEKLNSALILFALFMIIYYIIPWNIWKKFLFNKFVEPFIALGCPLYSSKSAISVANEIFVNNNN